MSFYQINCHILQIIPNILCEEISDVKQLISSPQAAHPVTRIHSDLFAFIRKICLHTTRHVSRSFVIVY